MRFLSQRGRMEAIDVQGWLHTGDIGAFDEQGNLSIIDRKKELIITAGGKNVSPANLEAEDRNNHAARTQRRPGGVRTRQSRL